MRLLVCGGRFYEERDKVFTALDHAQGRASFSMLIEGGASGADYLAAQWALARGVNLVECPANWKFHGREAGFIRNAFMMTLQPEAVIAFPGGTGTEMMVGLAQQAGVPVWRPYG